MQNTFHCYENESKELIDEIQLILKSIPSLIGCSFKYEQINVVRQKYLELEEIIEGMELCSASNFPKSQQEKMKEIIKNIKLKLSSIKQNTKDLEEKVNQEAKEELINAKDTLYDPNSSSNDKREIIQENTNTLINGSDAIIIAIEETKQMEHNANVTMNELGRHRDMMTGWKSKLSKIRNNTDESNKLTGKMINRLMMNKLFIGLVGFSLILVLMFFIYSYLPKKFLK